MLGVIFSVFIIVLAIIGLVEIFHIASLAIFKTQKDPTFIIVPISGHDEEAELILRNAISKVRWLPFSDKKKVICLDLGMDDETLQICKIIAYEYDFIEIYTIKEFENKIKSA